MPRKKTVDAKNRAERKKAAGMRKKASGMRKTLKSMRKRQRRREDVN